MITHCAESKIVSTSVWKRIDSSCRNNAGARGTMRAPMGSNRRPTRRPNRHPPGAMGPNGNARIELRLNNSRMNIRNNNGATLESVQIRSLPAGLPACVPTIVYLLKYKAKTHENVTQCFGFH